MKASPAPGPGAPPPRTADTGDAARHEPATPEALIQPAVDERPGEPSLATRFAATLADIAADTDAELEALWSGRGVGAADTDPRVAELLAICREGSELVDARLDEFARHTSDAAQPDPAPDPELAKSQLRELRMSIYSSEPGPVSELSATYRHALAEARRAPLQDLLAQLAPSFLYDAQLPDVLLACIERGVLDGDEARLQHLVTNTMLAYATQQRSPEPVWQLARSSGSSFVISVTGWMLGWFPPDVVEPLLLDGLSDENEWVRFGVMEAVRELGSRGKLDVPRFCELLIGVVRQFPESSRLHLEAVGALGRAEPTLAEFVSGTDDVELRSAAAGFFVLHADPNDALHRLREWLEAGAELRDIALNSLGLLPGDAGRELIVELYRDNPSASERERLLRAIAGRSEDFEGVFRDALRDPASEVRVAAVEALIDALLADTASAAIATADELGTLVRSDSSPAVRAQATLALGLEGGAHAQSILKERFLAESDAQVRGLAGAALFLRSLKDPQLAGWWDEAAASESNPFVRSSLQSLQSQLTDPERRAALLESISQREALHSRIDGALPAGLSKRPFAAQAGFDALLVELLSDDGP